MLFSVLWISKSSGLSGRGEERFVLVLRKRKGVELGSYLPRLGESERLPPLELLDEEDFRRLPLDGLRLPPPLLRRLSTDDTDLERLVERDGLRVFLTGLLDGGGKQNEMKRTNGGGRTDKLTWLLTD